MMAHHYYILAQQYWTGKGDVLIDYTKAAHYYCLAAERGLANAQSSLGIMYRDGHGVKKDVREAIRLFTLAAEQGQTEAQHQLALIYEKNIEFTDYEKAIRLYRLAAEKGHAEAQNNLAFIYVLGIHVKEDFKEAIRLYNLAVEQGFAAAQTNLGKLYNVGLGVEKDYKEAVRLYRLAAGQRFADAQFFLACCYYQGTGVEKDDEEAARLYRLASEQGHSLAQAYLGEIYYFKKDYKEAIRLSRLAVDKGVAIAQVNLGHMYKLGIVVEKDNKEAVRLYRLAAEQGYTAGQNNLGYMYCHGLGVKQDMKEAIRLFQLAADQGCAEAQVNLDQALKESNSSLRSKQQKINIKPIDTKLSAPKKTPTPKENSNLEKEKEKKIETPSYDEVIAAYLQFKKILLTKSGSDKDIPEFEQLRNQIKTHENLLKSQLLSSFKIMQVKNFDKLKTKNTEQLIIEFIKMYQNTFKDKFVTKKLEAAFDELLALQRKNSKEINDSYKLLEEFIKQYNQKFQEKGKSILSKDSNKGLIAEFTKAKEKWISDYKEYLNKAEQLKKLVEKANASSNNNYPLPNCISNDKMAELKEKNTSIHSAEISAEWVTKIQEGIEILNKIKVNDEINKYERIIKGNEERLKKAESKKQQYQPKNKKPDPAPKKTKPKKEKEFKRNKNSPTSLVSSSSVPLASSESFASSTFSPSSASFASSTFSASAASFSSSTPSASLKSLSIFSSPDEKQRVISPVKPISPKEDENKLLKDEANEARKNRVFHCMELTNTLREQYDEGKKIPPSDQKSLQFVLRAILRELAFTVPFSQEFRNSIAYNLASVPDTDEYTPEILFNALKAYISCITTEARIDSAKKHYLTNSFLINFISNKLNIRMFSKLDKEFKFTEKYHEEKLIELVKFISTDPLKHSKLPPAAKKLIGEKFKTLVMDHAKKSGIIKLRDCSYKEVMDYLREHHPLNTNLIPRKTCR
jgi:TPR repeat protein